MMDDYECIKLDGESRQDSICPVTEEVPLSIFINGRHFATAMISPDLRAEFLTGHLYSERIISSDRRWSLWRSRAMWPGPSSPIPCGP